MQITKAKMDLYRLSKVSIIRVLEALSESEKLVITQISRKTGLNHSTTMKALEYLCKAGLIYEDKDGNRRIFEPTFQKFRIQFRKKLGINIYIE